MSISELSKHYGSTDLSESQQSSAVVSSIFNPKRRYVVAVLAFIGFANIYAMRANLSMALVDMTHNRTATVAMRREKIPQEHVRMVRHSGDNEEDEDTVQEYVDTVIPPEFPEWDSMTQGLILGSFFYGYICTQLPGGWLSRKYGGKSVYLCGVFGAAVFTFLTPALAHMGSVALMFTRFIEGLFQGVTYPAIHAIWSHWAPPSEKTSLATIGFAGSYFGTVIAMPASALLAAYVGWPFIFYLFGFLATIWCFIWYKCVQDQPANDTHITTEELTYIQKEIGHIGHREDAIPWKSMRGSTAVWAIVIAHFCENWGFYTMLTSLPTLLHDMLQYKLESTGFLSALPYLMMGITVIVAGQLADHLRDVRRWSTVTVRKRFCCGAFIAQAIFTALASHAPTAGIAVGCITLSIGIGGFAWAGFSVNHLDLAPQYASVLMGISNTFATLPGMLSPLIVGLIVNDGLPSQWTIILYLTSFIYVIGAIAYWRMAKGEREPWAIDGGAISSEVD